MCGIVGMLIENAGPAGAGGPAGLAWRATLDRMLLAVRHRGPDGEGHFFDGGGGQSLLLGHRRLGVFAPGPLGAQPMTGPAGSRRYTLCFNGAIYNFLELGSMLDVRGEALRSDSAVLLAAWAAWGPACLSRLNGMFAFALWDADERALYLCRDRFGEKPLFYASEGLQERGARLLFASEAKAIFASRLVAPRCASQPLAEFLATHDIDHHGNVDGSTLFVGVSQVPAGCYLRIGASDLRGGDPPKPIRYFKLSPPARRRALDGDLIEETRALLASSLGMRLRSDVPLGGSLSGGLDSSLLTALVRQPKIGFAVDRPYSVFSCQFPEARDPPDESSWAEQVIRGLSLENQVVRVQPSAADFARDFERVLFHQEAPFADASICSHFALMRAVREHGVIVLLSGQGGDEVFAGYPSYYYSLLGNLLSAGRFSSLWQHGRTRARRTAEPLWRPFAGALYHSLPGSLRHHLYKQRRHGDFPLSPFGAAQLQSVPPRFGGPLPAMCGEPFADWSPFDVYLVDSIARWALPHILRHDDRNSMAFAIESRAPYLDHRLLELLLSVDPAARIGDGYTKRLLREVARGLLPEPVRLRVDKLGFFSPQIDWLWQSEAAVRAACAELPPQLAELTDAAVLSQQIDAFYRQRRRELSPVVWTAYVSSVFLGRVMPRLADAGI